MKIKNYNEIQLWMKDTLTGNAYIIQMACLAISLLIEYIYIYVGKFWINKMAHDRDLFTWLKFSENFEFWAFYK